MSREKEHYDRLGKETIDKYTHDGQLLLDGLYRAYEFKEHKYIEEYLSIDEYNNIVFRIKKYNSIDPTPFYAFFHYLMIHVWGLFPLTCYNDLKRELDIYNENDKVKDYLSRHKIYKHPVKYNENYEPINY